MINQSMNQTLCWINLRKMVMLLMQNLINKLKKDNKYEMEINFIVAYRFSNIIRK